MSRLFTQKLAPLICDFVFSFHKYIPLTLLIYCIWAIVYISIWLATTKANCSLKELTDFKLLLWRVSKLIDKLLQAEILIPFLPTKVFRTSYFAITDLLPLLHQVTIVKLLTQHVVRGDSWVPTNGSPPCW